MTDGGSFYGRPTARGRRDRLAVVAVILVVVGITVAIAKPWGDTGRHATPTDPGFAVTSPSVASTTDVASSRPSTAALTHLSRPLPVAFTAPLPGSAPWTTLVWQRLAPDDPLGAVTSEVGVAGRYVAIGDIAGATSTTVWHSADATHWQPLRSATSTTFWPSTNIIALATLQGQFVAITDMNDFLMQHLPPVMAWSSADGQRWVPANTLPVDQVSSRSAFTALVAAGPNGLVVATSGLAARLVTSSDGSHWMPLAQRAFPAGFSLNDLEATATGFVAVGGWLKGTSPARAAALWSADGRHWPRTPTLLPMAASASGTPVSNAVSLIVGDHGMIARGIGGSTGAALWWRSLDGRHWHVLEARQPHDATCLGASCDLPNATLVGDGHRILAWSGGAGASASVSTDGRQWTALRLAGDIPDAHATHATLLPGGILLSDGTTTWFGRAE